MLARGCTFSSELSRSAALWPIVQPGAALIRAVYPARWAASFLHWCPRWPCRRQCFPPSPATDRTRAHSTILVLPTPNQLLLHWACKHCAAATTGRSVRDAGTHLRPFLPSPSQLHPPTRCSDVMQVDNTSAQVAGRKWQGQDVPACQAAWRHTRQIL